MSEEDESKPFKKAKLAEDSLGTAAASMDEPENPAFETVIIPVGHLMTLESTKFGSDAIEEAFCMPLNTPIDLTDSGAKSSESDSQGFKITRPEGTQSVGISAACTTFGSVKMETNTTLQHGPSTSDMGTFGITAPGTTANEVSSTTSIHIPTASDIGSIEMTDLDTTTKEETTTPGLRLSGIGLIGMADLGATGNGKIGTSQLGQSTYGLGLISMADLCATVSGATSTSRLGSDTSDIGSVGITGLGTTVKGETSTSGIGLIRMTDLGTTAKGETSTSFFGPSSSGIELTGMTGLGTTAKGETSTSLFGPSSSGIGLTGMTGLGTTAKGETSTSRFGLSSSGIGLIGLTGLGAAAKAETSTSRFGPSSSDIGLIGMTGLGATAKGETSTSRFGPSSSGIGLIGMTGIGTTAKGGTSTSIFGSSSSGMTSLGTTGKGGPNISQYGPSTSGIGSFGMNTLGITTPLGSLTTDLGTIGITDLGVTEKEDTKTSRHGPSTFGIGSLGMGGLGTTTPLEALKTALGTTGMTGLGTSKGNTSTSQHGPSAFGIGSIDMGDFGTTAKKETSTSATGSIGITVPGTTTPLEALTTGKIRFGERLLGSTVATVSRNLPCGKETAHGTSLPGASASAAMDTDPLSLFDPNLKPGNHTTNIDISLKWEIPNFSQYYMEKAGHEVSAFFHKNSRELPTFRLVLYPRGVSEKYKEFLSLRVYSQGVQGLSSISSAGIVDYKNSFVKLVSNKKRSGTGIIYFDRFIKIHSLFEQKSALLPKDKLTIMFQVRIKDPEAVHIPNLPPNFEKDEETARCEEICKSFSNFLPEMYHDDLSLRSGDSVFRVNKCILMASSDIFREMFLKITDFQEVVVDDVRPEVLKEMVKFLYGGDVEIRKETVIGLWKVARKFGLVQLSVKVIDYLIDNLDSSNVAETLQFAEEHDIKGLKDKCIQNWRI